MLLPVALFSNEEAFSTDTTARIPWILRSGRSRRFRLCSQPLFKLSILMKSIICPVTLITCACHREVTDEAWVYIDPALNNAVPLWRRTFSSSEGAQDVRGWVGIYAGTDLIYT